MKAVGCNVDKMIEIRRKIHAWPEGGWNEFKTKEKIINALLGFGIEKKNIKTCAKTGLVVDISGTGPSTSITGKESGKIKTIAIRAEMDALLMPEHNDTLPYKSKNDHAHMCGHDGHMAILLATAQTLMKQRSSFPVDSTVRLLFQPSEETDGGAIPMIKEKCMVDVDEVYGLHNIPNFDEGDIRVCDGPFMA